MYDVGLGNRDEFRAANTVAETGERITICPVSSDGSDNKILLALHCKKMLPLRNAIDLETSTLEAKLQELKLSQETMNDVDVLRIFLDGENQTMNQYVTIYEEA